MASRSRLQFFSRKGSTFRERLSKLGERTEEDASGPEVRAAKDGGRSSSSEGGGDGSWWR